MKCYEFCNCTCCDINRGCFRFYRFVKRKIFRNKIDKNPSEIFNKADFLSARPSALITYGGKFESIDYNPSENQSYLDKEREKGKRYLSRQYLAKCLVLVLIGFFTGFSGAVLKSSSDLINCYKHSYFRSLLLEDQKNDSYMAFIYGFLINASFAFLGSFLIVFIEPAATGGGSSGVIGFLNGVDVPNIVTFKVYLIKMLSTMCMCVACLPGGREGPMIHIGACIGASLPNLKIPFTSVKVFPFLVDNISRRDFTAAGVAAGFSGTFPVPVGSLLMAFEEFVTFYSGDTILVILVCSLISAVSLRFFELLFSNELSDFNAKNLLFLPLMYTARIDSYTFRDLAALIIIGLIGAILGSVWIKIQKLMILFRGRYVKFKVLKVLEVILWTFIMHAIFTFLLLKTSLCSDIPSNKLNFMCSSEVSPYDIKFNCPEGQFQSMALFSYLGNSEIFAALFLQGEEKIPLVSAYIIFATYFITSGIFGGANIAAGLFIPCMLTGAAMGQCFAQTIENLSRNKLLYSQSIVWSFYGSISFLSSVVRLTYSVAIFFCEGTSNFILLCPAMIVVFCNKVISDLMGDGIYDVQSHFARIPTLRKYAPPYYLGLNAKDVMSKYPIVTLPVSTTLRRLLQVSFEYQHNGFPIVKGNANQVDGNPVGKLVGFILRSEILVILKDQLYKVDIHSNELPMFQRNLADYLSPAKASRSGFDLDAVINLETYMNISPVTIQWDTSLNRTYRMFCCLALRHLVVVNTNHEVLGIITRKDLAKYRTKYLLTGIDVKIVNFV